MHPLSSIDNDAPVPADETDVYTTHRNPAFIGKACIYMCICSEVHIRDAVYAHVWLEAKPKNAQSNHYIKTARLKTYSKRPSLITFIAYIKPPVAHLKKISKQMKTI